MGKTKISFAPKVNLWVAVMARLAKKVKIEPMRGVVSSPAGDGSREPVVTKVVPLTVVEPVTIECENSTESTRLFTQKCLRLGRC